MFETLFPGQINPEQTTLAQDAQTFLRTYKDGVKVRIVLAPETIFVLMAIIVFALVGFVIVKRAM